MRCPKCSTVIPHHARFCPKCGGAATADGGTGLPVAPGAHPSSAPIPRVGKLFIGSAALGLAMIVAGVAGGNMRLIFMGLVVLAVVGLVGLVGHHVS